MGEPAGDAVPLSAAPCRRDGLAAVELDGEAVVYDERTDDVHHFNATATVIWNALDGSCELSALVAELAAATGVSADTVREGVLAAVAEFRALDLLDPSSIRRPA